jgi:hypothetical protein
VGAEVAGESGLSGPRAADDRDSAHDRSGYLNCSRSAFGFLRLAIRPCNGLTSR